MEEDENDNETGLSEVIVEDKAITSREKNVSIKANDVELKTSPRAKIRSLGRSESEKLEVINKLF